MQAGRSAKGRSCGRFAAGALGATTVAVPQAPTSLKEGSSSMGSGRSSTRIPASAASAISILLVMDGRIEPDFGVTYAPSAATPTQLETENSSMKRCSTASR